MSNHNQSATTTNNTTPQVGSLLAHMTVAKRLYAGFGAILVIIAAVTVVAIIKVHTINEALLANSERHVLIQRYAINFRGSAHDRSIAIRDVVLSASTEAREKEKATIKRLAEFYANSAHPLESFVTASDSPPELVRLYENIKVIEAEAVASTNNIIAIVEKGDSWTEARDLLWSQAKPQYEQWLAAINKLIDFEEEKIQASNKIALAEAGNFLKIILTALALALLSGGALAWFISRSILTQLGAEPPELAGVAKRVANGDLRPVSSSHHAFDGSVLASLCVMQTGLANVVGQVRQASDLVAAGSTEIATSNAELSHRTEHQADHLQQTAASMEQMTATVQNTADAARQATQLAASASEAAAKGGTLVSQVVSTMNDISAESQKIADIISVIDGIAFQTNILALNASVEAARAGEQGRSFAVVAGEVRNLAQRSAEAAREIKELISASVGKIEVGSQLVGDAGTTMTDIVAQAHRVADLIAEISSSTSEQTQGIAQVNDAIIQLDDTTKYNASLGEKNATAADSLKQQAMNLTTLVSTFKL